jgi:EgtB-related family protein
MNGTSGGYSAAQALRTGGRAPVRQALREGRARTLALADAFRAALGPQLPVPLDPGLNPPLWELGHVAWFQDWWVGRNAQRALGAACPPEVARDAPALPQADAWYDSSRVAHAQRWQLPLPSFEGTCELLVSAQATTLALLDALPADAGADALYFFRLVALHEAMHAEAACYMARRLGIAVSLPAPHWPAQAELVLPAGRHRLGVPAGGFAFDNELQAHERAVGPVAIDARPVGWDDWQRFVDAGGWMEPRWWTPQGWDWRQREAAAAPAGEGPGPALHLSCHAAEAWCRWAGRRLPTEAEWECAALTLPGFAWGQCWEWTASDFAPYPGFVPHPYRDYSQPWFGSRRVLRGAGPATSPWLAHPRYRNFFEPHRGDIHAGWRSCRDLG